MGACVLLVDADSVLGRALHDSLVAAGFSVLAHARCASQAASHADANGLGGEALPRVLDAEDPRTRGVDHVVFCPRDEDLHADRRDEDLDAMADRLDASLTGFLAELQAAARQLARRDGGQLWVLTMEDSMRYYLDLPCTAIDSRARQAAAKSFAKEMLRFGVRINCASVQCVREQVEPARWMSAAAGLKAYAMKFKPNAASAVAATLVHFLQQPDLPIAGTVVPLGIGVAEGNV
ncbi:hypothetical protein [Ramlibacter sp.]|uniref:hypothetical protein n=1 Tax=Ramlibacter sp. TaxID=1917967 RepID=UPI00182FBE4D|nr:hypothetical protein [Ramlibacter sp.]MBA2672713.1 hypothetical protein [Ramlibacter sp.]